MRTTRLEGTQTFKSLSVDTQIDHIQEDRLLETLRLNHAGKCYITMQFVKSVTHDQCVIILCNKFSKENTNLTPIPKFIYLLKLNKIVT